MHVLADFLNHGTLPFVGREQESRRIIDFWRRTFEATELRAMLLTGEAGIGKSRLLEHAMHQIVEAGGSVVHVKLYPEATASFMSLVARALLHRDAGGSLLGEEPEAKPGPVGAALQRLARLRPTLFVLEDLHLLGNEALSTLGRLLKMLADETISLLVLARPVELEARGALEPYLVEELVLQGFMQQECARIWQMVSGSGTGPEMAAALHEATAGNPLALRSALREVLKSADVAKADSRIRWRSPESAASLAGTLKRTVGLLADGMTAHLSREELKGARQLASLGEIFSREAAAVMIKDVEPILESLLFKGIIATAVAPPASLPDTASAQPPLGFTHTLLHRQLIDSSPPDVVDGLVRVIADSPLYSILPFRLLSEKPCYITSLDTDTIGRAFDRTIRVQVALGHSVLWRNTEQTWATALRLLASRLGAWEQHNWERMLIRIIYHKLNLVRREPAAVRSWWLEYLSSVTAGASSDEMIKGRIYVLMYRDLLHSAGRPEITREVWEEAEKLIAGYPHLRFTFAYTDYILAACIGANINKDTEMRRRIEARANELLASDDLPVGVRSTFERKVRPSLLSLYENEDDVRVRLAQIAAFEESISKSDVSVWSYCIDLLADVAAADMLNEIGPGVIAAMREQGVMRAMAGAFAKLQRIRAGRGDSLADLIAVFNDAAAEVPQWPRTEMDVVIVLPLVDAALLRGESDYARDLIVRYTIAGHLLQPAQQVMLALYADDPRTALKAVAEAHGLENNPDPLIGLARTAGAAADVPALKKLLDAPLLQLMDLLKIEAIAGMIEPARAEGSIPADLIDALADALARSLEWLAAPGRGLFAYMRPMLKLGRGYLTSRKAAAWEKKIDELAAVHDRGQGTEINGRVKISMLGAITAQMPDGRVQRFQGARARMLLAMMVVNGMLKESLSSAEFCRIAAGGDAVEIENARDVVKTTVHRIREQIGRDAILTDGQAPRLNPQLVEVDLLEAHHLLKRAVEAMRRSSPMQAKGALVAAMEITRGEVPFPSLYDDFIEAVREDFETELRTTAIDVARTLTREGGGEDAAEVLRHASSAIPGDEELAELLCTTLVGTGKRAEAERMKRKLELNY